MADCALCGHPREEHKPRCTHPDNLYGHRFGELTATCGCPYEPPEDEEND